MQKPTDIIHPVTERKLNLHKSFRRRRAFFLRSVYILCLEGKSMSNCLEITKSICLLKKYLPESSRNFLEVFVLTYIFKKLNITGDPRFYGVNNRNKKATQTH